MLADQKSPLLRFPDQQRAVGPEADGVGADGADAPNARLDDRVAVVVVDRDVLPVGVDGDEELPLLVQLGVRSRPG